MRTCFEQLFAKGRESELLRANALFALVGVVAERSES